MRRSVARWNAAFMRQNGVPEEICPARPAQAPRHACSIVQLQRAVQPVEQEKTEGTENFWRWERVFDMEFSRFTEWRVGVGFAHRGEFKASFRLLCFLLFRPEWLPLQSARLRGDPSATRSRLFHIHCNLS